MTVPLPRSARAGAGHERDTHDRGEGEGDLLGPFLAITPDDHVIVYSPSSEMGRGITTTLAPRAA